MSNEDEIEAALGRQLALNDLALLLGRAEQADRAVTEAEHRANSAWAAYRTAFKKAQKTETPIVPSEVRDTLNKFPASLR